MKVTTMHASLRSPLLAALCAAALCGAPGCRKGLEIRIPPETMASPHKSLPALVDIIRTRWDFVRSLSADCEAAIRSPALRDGRPVELKGRFHMLRSGEVSVTLGRQRREEGIVLIGNGERYRVRMPLLQPHLPNANYDGTYGEEVGPVAQRLHFIPDHLVDGLHPARLIQGTVQTLKACPDGVDWFAGTPAQPNVHPAVWFVDSVMYSETPEKAFKVVNSIMIDRTTEQIVRIDKFRFDGTLMVRMWFFDPAIVGTQHRSIKVPRQIMIWYPEPLEGTFILLRFSGIKVNEDIPEEKFALGPMSGLPPRGSAGEGPGLGLPPPPGKTGDER